MMFLGTFAHLGTDDHRPIATGYKTLRRYKGANSGKCHTHKTNLSHVVSQSDFMVIQVGTRPMRSTELFGGGPAQHYRMRDSIPTWTLGLYLLVM